MVPGFVLAAPADAVGSDPVLSLARAAVLVEALLAAIAIFGALLSQRGVGRALGFTRSRLPWSDVAALCVGTLALSHGLDAALHWTGWIERSVLAELPELLYGTGGSRLVVALDSLAVFPAVAEEMLCRGWIQGVLVRRFGAAAGIAGSALVFGALHLDPVHVVAAAVLGLYLGVVAHWAGSILPAILCHGLNNAAAVTLAAQLGPSSGGLPTLLGAGAVAVGALVWVGRRRARREAIDPSGS